MMKAIMLAVLLAICAVMPRNSLAFDGEVRLGLGAALNNSEPTRSEVHSTGSYKGQAIDASAVWYDVLRESDLQLSWTYILESDFGTEQAVTATLLRGDRFKYGAGLILGYTQAYETWQRDYHQAIPIVGPRQCTFCGVTVQAAYEYKRAQIQLRYWRTDFNLYPGHNGALLFVTVRL
jgi:hypothetical protein